MTWPATSEVREYVANTDTFHVINVKNRFAGITPAETDEDTTGWQVYVKLADLGYGNYEGDYDY